MANKRRDGYWFRLRYQLAGLVLDLAARASGDKRRQWPAGSEKGRQG